MSEFRIPTPRYAESFDGTPLALYEMGRRGGPVLFLVNGLGGNLGAWRFVIDHFQDLFHIVSYDYRGMYASRNPPTRDFSMASHVEDALFVWREMGVDQAVVMGWSMGVQVVLELVCRIPEKVLGLILANGAFGRPLDRLPGLKPLAMATMELAAAKAHLLRPLARPLLRTALPLKLAKAVGFVSRQLDEQVFLDLARDFAELDFDNYRDCVASLLNHDAEHLLPTIKAPTLILGGGRDLFTPASFSRVMEERIPDARLRLLDDASHYAAVEYPGVLISHIEAFLLDKLPHLMK